MKDLIGKKLGQYEITEKIGEGGMAHVYKAFQPSLKRFVAIKVLSPDLARDPGFTERFQREALAVARLNHPNILQVYDSGIQDSYNYLVMRLVRDSLTLGTLMNRNVAQTQLFDYVAQVADALHYAHQQGIIHRDIKPGNILIDNKWALLSDFGLVKDRSNTLELTGTGVGMGTPAYMSPEQARGENVDHRTDIYALGIILHKILTNTVPHEAPTPLAMMFKRTTEPVESIRKTNPDISASLEYVTLRALATHPDQRYSSAVQFAEALENAKTDPHYQGEPTLVPNGTDEATLVSDSEFGEKTAFDSNEDQAPTLASSPGIFQSKNKTFLAILGGTGLILLVVLLFAVPALTRETATVGEIETVTLPATADAAEQDTPTMVAQAEPSTNTPLASTETPPLAASGPPQATIKEEMEIWAGPGSVYPLLGYLPDGVNVEITGRDRIGEWWQIKTSLGSEGIGWIRASEERADWSNTEGVPIALAPPTPTPSPTATVAEPTATPEPPPTNTSEPTATPTPSADPAATSLPTPTPAPALAEGEFRLLKPTSLDNPSFGLTEFEWQWRGPLPDNYGFEVRVWREGEPPTGVHNAVLDNQNGTVEMIGDNTYRLVADISQAAGVQNRRGDYNWTVKLVQIEPEYKDLGIQAPPERLRFEPPGGSSGGGDDGGGSSGGGSFN